MRVPRRLPHRLIVRLNPESIVRIYLFVTCHGMDAFRPMAVQVIPRLLPSVIAPEHNQENQVTGHLAGFDGIKGNIFRITADKMFSGADRNSMPQLLNDLHPGTLMVVAKLDRVGEGPRDGELFATDSP